MEGKKKRWFKRGRRGDKTERGGLLLIKKDGGRVRSSGKTEWGARQHGGGGAVCEKDEKDPF